MGLRQAESYGDGVVYHGHLLVVEPAHVFPEAAFVDGADLLQEDHGVLAQAYAASGDVDVGGEPGFSGLAGDGGGDDRGGVAVAGVVLDDEHRPGAALLAAHHRGQVGVENVPPFHCVVHMVSHSVHIIGNSE